MNALVESASASIVATQIINAPRWRWENIMHFQFHVFDLSGTSLGHGETRLAALQCALRAAPWLATMTYDEARIAGIRIRFDRTREEQAQWEAMTPARMFEPCRS
jgi:hypothetical protein